MADAAQKQLNDATEQANLLASAFTTQFYQLLGKSPADLLPMYHPSSAQLFVEENRYYGVKSIHECQKERFNDTMFAVTKCDGQWIGPSQVIINVVGQLTSPTQEKPLGFTHVFVLVNEGGNWLITNEIFRLNLHNF